LVKILAEKLVHEGKLEWGHQVQLGYYAQNQAEALDGSKTVLATIEEAAPEELRKSARKLLGNFMFAGDDVEKKVSVLSGGERGRLALCQLMLHPINLLILDEPTNHLDMQAKDVLKQSLESYEGTLVVVSHDREFLDGLANLTYEFKEGKIKQYLGGIEYFLEQRKMQSMREVELQQDAKKQQKAEAAAKSKAPQSASREEVKEAEKNLRQAEREEKKAQEAFEHAHAALDAVDQLMANPVEFKKVSSEPDFYQRYEGLQKSSEAAFETWEKATAQLSSCQQAWDAIAP
jgi:ATP-binding cassette subfamily F protein 3